MKHVKPLFQDLLLLRADDRGVQHGALPGHLPPALLAHHERIQEGSQDHRAGLGRVPSGGAAVRSLHKG